MTSRSVHLDRLPYFIAVAETGGFTAAAERLGTTKTLVSQQVARLEAELGGTLFQRTTRRVTLTEAGQRLLDECRSPLQELGQAMDRVGTASGYVGGSLRVTAPPEYAATVIGPLLAKLARRHPGLKVNLSATSEVLNLVERNIDVAIRIGWLRDSSLRLVRLGRFREQIVASSDYLADAGTPRQPRDLADHRWISLSLLRAPLSWHFTARNGQTQKVRVNAFMRSDSPQGVLGLLRGGGGISALPDFIVEDDIRHGRLVRLLDGWNLPEGGIYSVYPDAHHVPSKVRAFIDFLRENLVS